MKILDTLRSWKNLTRDVRIFQSSGWTNSLLVKGYSRLIGTQHGWTEQQLQRLSNQTQAILYNFNKISRNRIHLKIHLCQKRSDGQEESFDVDFFQGKINIYLDASPENVMQDVRLRLPLRLVSLLLQINPLQKMHFTGLYQGNTKALQMIERGVSEMCLYFANHGGAPIEISSFPRRFYQLSQKFCTEITKYGLRSFMLRRYPLSREEIKTEIQTAISGIFQSISNIKIDLEMSDPIEILAHLAMLAAIAEKHGLSQTGLQVKAELSSEIGVQLALIRAEFYGVTKLDYTQKHPSFLNQQIIDSIPKSKKIFDLFYEIFTSYQKEMEARLKFILIYGDKTI